MAPLARSPSSTTSDSESKVCAATQAERAEPDAATSQVPGLAVDSAEVKAVASPKTLVYTAVPMELATRIRSELREGRRPSCLEIFEGKFFLNSTDAFAHLYTLAARALGPSIASEDWLSHGF